MLGGSPSESLDARGDSGNMTLNGLSKTTIIGCVTRSMIGRAGEIAAFLVPILISILPSTVDSQSHVLEVNRESSEGSSCL